MAAQPFIDNDVIPEAKPSTLCAAGFRGCMCAAFFAAAYTGPSSARPCIWDGSCGQQQAAAVKQQKVQSLTGSNNTQRRFQCCAAPAALTVRIAHSAKPSRPAGPAPKPWACSAKLACSAAPATQEAHPVMINFGSMDRGFWLHPANVLRSSTHLWSRAPPHQPWPPK